MQASGSQRVGAHPVRPLSDREEVVERSTPSRSNTTPRPRFSLDSQSPENESSPELRANGAGPDKKRPLPLLRAKTDLGPRREPRNGSDDGTLHGDEDYNMRHGWESQFRSDEHLTFLTQVGSPPLFAPRMIYWF